MEALVGITLKDLLSLLKENRNSVEAKYWRRLVFLFISGLINSRDKRKEDKLYQEHFKNVIIEQPVFILGHWRSGTTLLHNLLTLDDQFAYPNLFQVSRPHQFLFREAMVEKRFEHMKAQKRAMDNMEVTFRDPGEDESGISVMSQRSPLISWTFPNNHSYYTRFHTFANVDNKDIERWQNSLLVFFKKLTWRYKKPLVLKSPLHTGRIEILLQLFPDARFIHIVRNPYTVFKSTQKLYRKMLPKTCLQTPDFTKWDDYIIEDYKTMYDAFLGQKAKIPKKQFYELRFENLEKDKMVEIEEIYKYFKLSGFENLKTKIFSYEKKNKNFKKNIHSEINESLIGKINKTWSPFFDAFNYPLKELSDINEG